SRSLCSTVSDLGPDGLSRSSTPLTASPMDTPLVVLLTRHRVVDQPGQAHTALDRAVVYEADLGSDAQLQPMAQLGAQEARRVPQAGRGACQSLGVGQRS